MRKRNTLKLDMSGFEELITKLDELGGNLKPVIDDALTQAAETVADDTVEAMATKYLPAQGKYSQGETKESIIRRPTVEWKGTLAEIGVGFDYGEPGAGGFLISGTPRMQPNQKLVDIYKRKKYMRALQEDMAEIVNDAIDDAMKGANNGR